MIFHPTELPGVVVIELEPYVDERGVFMRTFDAEIFAGQGLDARVAQWNSSFNPRAGTLRGLHYQVPPYAESKLVRCTKGRVYDVAVDMRLDSPTHGRWFGIELAERDTCCLLMSEGFAHGYQTLEDHSEVHYQATAPYTPDANRGVRWDDPAFAIDWPDPPHGLRIVSARDRAFPDYSP
jgi:dTDP-4-dehydrorhamnose 3,5-epimerase